MKARQTQQARRRRPERGLYIQRRVMIVFAAGVLLLAGALLWWQFRTQPDAAFPSVTLQPGATAADIQLVGTNSQPFRLQDYRGKPVLLSFLSTVPDTVDSLSRRQKVSLTSMRQQYHAKGLEVAIVDETGLEGGNLPSQDALINVTYDWHLGQLPLLQDTEAHTTARLYGVKHTPTTFLIATDGTIAQCWEGVALSAQLALSIQQQVQKI